MNFKEGLYIGLKIIILAIILLICDFIGASVAGLQSVSQTASPGYLFSMSFLASLATAAALSYPVLKSKWQGWPLIAAVFGLVFGIRTFLTQIETVVFLKHLADIVPAEMIPKLWQQGFISALIFSPLVVLICGKFKKAPQKEQKEVFISLTFTQWLGRLLAAGLLYLIIYIAFGMLVFRPLVGSAFEQYYGNLQMPLWIFPFQVLRGMVWTFIALPVMAMMRGKWWESGLAVALLFAVLMGALLIIPNEFMPDNIRLGHFVEVFSSNFLFGWVVAWLFGRNFACKKG